MGCCSRRRCSSQESGPRAEARGWLAPTVICFGGDCLGRRKSGVCGFAAEGLLVAACRLFCGLSPGPSPSLRFWGGVGSWLLERGIGRLCRLGGVGVSPKRRCCSQPLAGELEEAVQGRAVGGADLGRGLPRLYEQ